MKTIPRPLVRLALPLFATALLSMPGCGGRPEETAPTPPPAQTGPAIVKTYACSACGSVTTRRDRTKPCPRQKDGGPCRWKEIPRKPPAAAATANTTT